MSRRTIPVLLAICACALAIPAAANAGSITFEPNALTLGNELLANNTQLLNNPTDTNFADIPSGTPHSSGLINTPLLGFPTVAGKGVFLSSGKVEDAEAYPQEVTESDSFVDPALAPHSAKAHDVTTLKVGVNVPGDANCLALDYRFLSEEYPDYVNSSFNDAFIAQVDTNDWSNPDPYVINRAADFAADPGGEPVSVNGIGATALVTTEAAGTVFNAATGLVTTKTPISPGAHHIYLSIFDASDHILDSAVMLDNLRFISESATTCKPPLAKELAPPPEPPSNAFSVTTGSSVKFLKGSASVTVSVPGPGVLSGADAGASGATASITRHATISKKKSKKKAKYAPLVKPVTVTATAAGPVVLSFKLTKTGLKTLNKTGKLKVKLALTFTPTGGTAATQIKQVTITKAKPKKHKKH